MPAGSPRDARYRPHRAREPSPARPLPFGVLCELRRGRFPTKSSAHISAQHVSVNAKQAIFFEFIGSDEIGREAPTQPLSHRHAHRDAQLAHAERARANAHARTHTHRPTSPRARAPGVRERKKKKRKRRLLSNGEGRSPLVQSDRSAVGSEDRPRAES